MQRLDFSDLPVNRGRKESQGALKVKKEKIWTSAAGTPRIMPDLNLRIHQELHPLQAGAGAKVHVFEIESKASVHAAELAVGFGAHQPEHACDPIGADHTVAVRQVRLEGVTGQTAANQLEGSGKRAVGILHGSGFVHDLGSDQIRLVSLEAAEQTFKNGSFQDEIGVEDREIFAARLLEGAVVIFGKTQLPFVAQNFQRCPRSGVEIRQVVLQVIGQDHVKTGAGVRLVCLNAGEQTRYPFGVAMADDGEGDERQLFHLVRFR